MHFYSLDTEGGTLAQWYSMRLWCERSPARFQPVRVFFREMEWKKIKNWILNPSKYAQGNYGSKRSWVQTLPLPLSPYHYNSFTLSLFIFVYLFLLINITVFFYLYITIIGFLFITISLFLLVTPGDWSTYYGRDL